MRTFPKRSIAAHLLLLVLTSTAQALPQGTPLLCQQTAGDGQVLTVKLLTQAGLHLQVLQQDEVVYDMAVVEDVGSDRVNYHSSQFLNANHAPSGLQLMVYQGEAGLVGQFSEVSFLPVVRLPGYSMTCETAPLAWGI